MTRGYLPQTPKLSPRLQMIAQMVPYCNRVIDIGTDHAFIPIYLVATGKCAEAVATDIKKGPADIARRNISEYCMEDLISVLVQDGLGEIGLNENDCLVISGMGSYEIQSILMKKAPVNAGTIILQPQKSMRAMRKFLSETGYRINEEVMTNEKEHFYVAMDVTYTGISYELSPLELEAGPCLAANMTVDYKNHLIKKLRKQIIGDPSLAGILKELEDEVSI